MALLTGKSSSPSGSGWIARGLLSVSPHRTSLTAGSVSACFQTLGWGAGEPQWNLLICLALLDFCRLGCTQVGSGKGTRGLGLESIWTISGMQTFTYLQVYLNLSAARDCNAKGRLYLGGERGYLGAFMLLRALVISLNALHRPFISLLSSEFQQNRYPNPPFCVFHGYSL